MGNYKEDNESGTDLLEDVQNEIKRPTMYKVVLMNDDYTPMDFVVDVLTRFFSIDSDQATEIMLTIHYKGKGICGTYTSDVAETKVDQVCRHARINEHPLMCAMEPA